MLTIRMLLIFIVSLSFIGCQSEPLKAAKLTAAPWPEADALFHQDPNWLGSDCAYSIVLGNDRVLWLFGDSFIATSDKRVRSESRMVRNSIAIQTGYDPTTADIDFFWRKDNGSPSSFFSEDGELWLWPGHGIRLEDKLLIFMMVMSADGDWFKSAGWRAVMITNPDDEPASWKLNWLESPSNEFNVVTGSGGVVKLDNEVFAFGSEEPGEHDIFLAKWPISQITEGDLSNPSWHTRNGWVMQNDLESTPDPVFHNGQTEFTVHYEPALNKYVEIQTVGFGKSDIVFRTADSLIGSWSKVESFYRPQEYDWEDIMIYSAKAHPELSGADFVVTYCTNSFKFNTLVHDDRLYYPRFLKVEVLEKN